ncbi:MAG TPA: aconitase/3-isopropylmalate dehydratase large subunit family protein, partial [Bacteroidales bacterium]|nr:aconitase/3-isopropylmalate dehydratase large subunit family protein [Bacteroidales bacterium]
MGMTLIEKILAAHSGNNEVVPDQIVDVTIDARAARDFGGANVVKNLLDNNLTIADPARTFFTFDCNPTGSDQKYAANQQKCRIYAREQGIKVYDISSGIGTHLLIEEGLVYPGATAVSTDSHANILGAVGAFGQGMGDQDIAAAWHQGSVWFKVPHSVKITIEGQFETTITAKDIVLNLLAEFGANKLLGYSVELQGDALEQLTLDQRITISSMATEMGAIIILFTPNKQVMEYCEARTGRKLEIIKADADAKYKEEYKLQASQFAPRVSRPGHPHDTVELDKLGQISIDSAFIGSCTNGRIEDMRAAASVLKDRKVAPGVVLKIVPSTDEVWKQCLHEGLVDIFKEAGASLSHAGCAGCAAGQVGQNGPGEVTIGTGNRNFPGKQGMGEVYLATPAVVAASAVAGYITDPLHIPSAKKKPSIQETKRA